MQLTATQLTLPGALPGPQDPQPFFRAPVQDLKVPQNGTFLPRDEEGYGVGCGARTLPYRMQDRYTRSSEPVSLPALVLENEHLKATLMPTLGGRLWSLFDKDEGRELLFENPVLRVANLGIRNAWFSGGVEWNLGHTGHHVFTCSPLYSCKVTAADGEEFLRMYQYEAIQRQVYQLDFHLPDGAKQLAVHVRIENTLDSASPLYWWTNTAVPLTAHTRVFSPSGQVLHQLQMTDYGVNPGFGRCEMPCPPTMGGADASYPWDIPFSTEYFFQNERTEPAPWEVAAEEDGRGLFERSTQPLFARKMFCWGNLQGGRHWCDYLSNPGEGDYIEVQAGLAPTQLHTATIGPKAVVSFTQIFGAFTAPANHVAGEWHDARDKVARQVETLLPAADVVAIDAACAAAATLPGGSLLFAGDERGGLERLRRAAEGEGDFAPHLAFPAPDPESALWPWVEALGGGMLPDTALPAAYMTAPEWLGRLEALAARPDATAAARFQWAVALVENDREAEALPVLEALAAAGDAFAAAALGKLAARREDWAAAADWFTAAHRLEGNKLDVSFAELALEGLVRAGRHGEAWALWQALPESRRTQSARLSAAEAAVKLGKLDFVDECFRVDYAMIREGALGLANVWFEAEARKKAAAEGRAFTETDIDRTLPLPRELDYRMF